jgi:hypothetical protein
MVVGGAGVGQCCPADLSDHLLDSVNDLVDKLVPELQERGVYRTEYTTSTLREHLQLPAL